MKNNCMKKALLGAAIAVLPFISIAAQAETVRGKLVDLSSVENSLTIDTGAAPDKKKLTTYKVAQDAHWRVCIKDACEDKKGVDGFKAVNEYAEFGAYGIPRKTYDVTLKLKDKMATELEVQIVPKAH